MNFTAITNSPPISQMLYRIVGVLKGVVKIFANFTGKHLWRVKFERKSLILSNEACTFIIKESPAHSCFPLSYAEFLRIPFF